MTRKIVDFMTTTLLIITAIFALINLVGCNTKIIEDRGADVFGQAKGWYTVSERENIMRNYVRDTKNVEIETVYSSRISDNELNYYVVYTMDNKTYICEHYDDNGNYIDRTTGNSTYDAVVPYAKVPN